MPSVFGIIYRSDQQFSLMTTSNQEERLVLLLNAIWDRRIGETKAVIKYLANYWLF